MAFIRKHFLKTIFKPRVVRQKKRIRIARDQEFDEIEDRRKNIGERIDDRKDTRKIQQNSTNDQKTTKRINI